MENDNYGIHFNALKYVNSGVLNIKGRSETKRCLVVPIEDNHLFESVNEDGSPKAVYLDLNAFALREPKYEQTHIVKQSLPKDVRESMTKEQLDAMSILGGMKPLVNPSANAATASNVPFAQPTEDDSDLPF
nr:MAG TPA: hypothetical protein [Caudoviricetes sp.]